MTTKPGAHTKKTTKTASAKKAAAPPQYDAVVIGSGMGGCAAGAILALYGLKTLILEKNPRPGGSCSYYEKQGFKMDVGTHLFIRANNGPFGTCTRRLGMGDAIRFLQTRKMTRFYGMNMDVTVPNGKLGMLMMAPKFAYQLKIPVTQYPNVLKMFYDILAMDMARIEALDAITIDEFVRRYTDHTQLRGLLGFLLGLFFILPTWKASAGESIWNLQQFAKDMLLGYPKGGAGAISSAILTGARRHGATVKVSAGVKKINITRGRVQGVTLENGEKITAKCVISTTSLKDTVLTLSGENHFPPDFVSRVKKIKGSMIAVQAKFALKKPLVQAGSLVGGYPIKLDRQIDQDLLETSYHKREQGQQSDFVPVYCPIPTNYDPDLAPKGCQIITACAVAPTLDIGLKDNPDKWVDSMLNALKEMIPGLEENTIFCDTWSVKKIASWIGKSNGAAVTTGQTTDQVGVKRPGHQTPVKGLYIAGDCGGPARGVGTELACQSGMDCGDLVARDIFNRVF